MKTYIVIIIVIILNKLLVQIKDNDHLNHKISAIIFRYKRLMK